MSKRINSRSKGKRGELELCHWLADTFSIEARRGQQFSGANGDPDIVGTGRLHCEVKRVERLNVGEAMRQSIRDARPGTTPTLWHRRNNEQWLLTLRASDAVEFAKAMLSLVAGDVDGIETADESDANQSDKAVD